MPIQIVGKLIGRWWKDSIIDRFRLWRARIEGIEVTQAIQCYRSADHLTTPADYGPDNSATLVAGKSALVRVYVVPGLFSQESGLTGTLLVERRHHGFLYLPAATLNPQSPATVTADNALSYADRRGNLNNSLNFVIPAADFFGVLRLTVTLTSGGTVRNTRTIFVDATLTQTLRIRAFLVSYNGPSTSVASNPPPPNLTLAAPTLADVQATAARAFRMMPVRATGAFFSAGTVACTAPLDDPRSAPGACSTNWGTLLAALQTARTNDGNRADVVYYGLLPTGIPLNVPGCGNNGLGSGAVGDQGTFVHEIGHGYGFAHTPCGAAGTTDPNYPGYLPYASASIGEYGLDISTRAVQNPNTISDYMSYCFPQWMSLYQHRRLIGHDRLAPVWNVDRPLDVPVAIDIPLIPELWLPDPPPFTPWLASEMKRHPIISIIGQVGEGGEITVASVSRVLAAGTPPGQATDLRARLLDPTGKTLAAGTVYRDVSHGGGCGCGPNGDVPPKSYSFQAFIPDVELGAALDIVGGKLGWRREAPSVPTRVILNEIAVRDDILLLHWFTEGSEPEGIWAQWSGDSGLLWHSLAVGLSGRSGEVPLTGLPAGNIDVRLLAHDGFSTAISPPVTVTIPRRPPEVAILHPSDGQRIAAGRSLQLSAAIVDQVGWVLEKPDCRWTIDGKPAGETAEVWTVAPQDGKHEIMLIVKWSGGEVIRRVAIESFSIAK